MGGISFCVDQTWNKSFRLTSGIRGMRCSEKGSENVGFKLRAGNRGVVLRPEGDTDTDTKVSVVQGCANVFPHAVKSLAFSLISTKLFQG